ncbi:class I SAM-dependent methyltransferase [Nannocystaceae bacterium ST9]
MPTTTYDAIGTGYDGTRHADPYLVERLDALLADAGAPILDLGCGTGNYTLALAERGRTMIGVDPSTRMLDEARSKSDAIAWTLAGAEGLPFADRWFAAAIATLTIHHWTDLHVGFAELARVLRPGARVVVFTSTPEQMRGYWLNHYFPTMLERSMAVMPSLAVVGEALTFAGFVAIRSEPYAVREDLRDLFLYSGKHAPARYLDPSFRRAISSFAALAEPDELSAGLERLADDLEHGRWAEVSARATGELGDYLFVVAERG